MVLTVYLGLLERNTEGPQEREAISHNGPESLSCPHSSHPSEPRHALYLVRAGASSWCPVSCHLSVKTLGDITSIAYPNMELRRPALVSAAFPRSQGCCMGLRSPEAPAANGWGLLTNVYIPVLHQRGLKTLGKPLLLLDLSLLFL